MPTEAASLSTCDSVIILSRLAAAVEATVAAHTESFPAIIAAHFQSALAPECCWQIQAERRCQASGAPAS